jgi:hypothetical protein
MGTRDWTRAEWKLSGSRTPKLADQGEDKALEGANIEDTPPSMSLTAG